MKPAFSTIIRKLEPVTRALEAFIVPQANGGRDSHGKPLMPEAEARERLRGLLDDMRRVMVDVGGDL